MVFGAFTGIILGMYGAYQLAKEPFQIAKEETIKEKRGNVDIDVVCKYMGVKKIDDIYPSHAFDDIERVLRRNFYFKDNEIEQMRKKFDRKRKEQINIRKKKVNDEYNKLMKEYQEKKDDPYKDEYYEVRHWHHITKEQHQERINQIYNDELWHQICIEPPRLMKNDKLRGHIEVWHIKKPYGIFNKDKYYNTVCEKLKYDNLDLREKQQYPIKGKQQGKNVKQQGKNVKQQSSVDKQQSANTKQESIDDKYQKLIEAYKKKSIMGYKEDYYEVKHWNHLSKQEHQKRIDEIYKDELWGMLALEEPKLVKNGGDAGYTEVWYIKKPNGIFNTNKYYNTVCEKLKYDNSDLRKTNNNHEQGSVDTTINNYSTCLGMLEFIKKDKETQFPSTMHSSKTSSNDFDEDNLKKEIDYVKNSTYRTKVIMSLDDKVKISSEIANDAGILQNNIYNTIRQLKEHELIECINPEVKKGKLYRLTEKGKKINNGLRN